MEKRRLFKTLFGLALTAALVQSLQAAQPAPAPVAQASRSWLGDLAYRAGRGLPHLFTAAVSQTPDQVRSAASTSGNFITNYYAQKVKTLVKIAPVRATLSQVATQGSAGLRSVVAVQGAVSGVAADAGSSIKPLLGLAAQTALHYTANHLAQQALGNASKNGLVNLVPMLPTALKLASWLPWLAKISTVVEGVASANTLVPSNGVLVKDGNQVKISTPGLLATLKIGALGAAAYTAHALAMNKVTNSPSSSITRDVMKAFASSALLYNGIKAYQEFSATRTPVSGIPGPGNVRQQDSYTFVKPYGPVAQGQAPQRGTFVAR